MVRRSQTALRDRSDRHFPPRRAEDGLDEAAVDAVRERHGERLERRRRGRERGVGHDDEALAGDIGFAGDVRGECSARGRVTSPEEGERDRDALSDVEELLACRMSTRMMPGDAPGSGTGCTR